MSKPKNITNSVLILDGIANAISVARSLGKQGVNVLFVSNSSDIPEKSRYINKVYPVTENQSLSDFLNELLLEKRLIPTGTVLFPCGDAAITFIAKNRQQLSKKYLLDIHDSHQQLQMLDKQETLKLARMTDVQIPNHWNINNIDDIKAILSDINFPVLIKPIVSHIFQAHFEKKLFLVNSKDELLEQAVRVFDAGIEFFICEFIPGPDSLLSSYYTYINEDGERLFEYTKRVFRRAPKNFGGGTYHESKWLPETAAKGYQFFKGINFKGLGNIEFKYDERDGQLKVIECNARFTAAQELVTRSGIDMPNIIYQYLVHDEKPGDQSFKDNVTLLLPFEDLDAFRDLRQLNELTFLSWIKSLLRPQVFCYFSLSDPKPFFYAMYIEVKRRATWFLNKFKK